MGQGAWRIAPEISGFGFFLNDVICDLNFSRNTAIPLLFYTNFSCIFFLFRSAKKSWDIWMFFRVKCADSSSSSVYGDVTICNWKKNLIRRCVFLLEKFTSSNNKLLPFSESFSLFYLIKWRHFFKLNVTKISDNNYDFIKF